MNAIVTRRTPTAASTACPWLKPLWPCSKHAAAAMPATPPWTHVIETEVHRLESGVAAIGTIASLAPFVGLFGTVVGIIKAFNSIAANSGGGTEAVSAGIAEALVTTACGLLVAIPAVAFYNYCAHRIRSLARETELAVYDLVVWLSDHDVPQTPPPARVPESRAAPRY